MKTFKIYNTSYPLSALSSSAADAYALRNELYDEPPSGKKVGYVTLEDGSVIECYVKFNKAIIAIPMCCCIAVILSVLTYIMFFQEKDAQVAGIPIKVGVDKNIVSYNGFMSLSNNTLDVNFQNGDYPATITIVADGVVCDTVEVEPNQYIAKVPATFTSEDGNIEAKIQISTETSYTEQKVIIEIPSNIDKETIEENTPNVKDTSDGNTTDNYWKGEYIYGTGIDSTN